MEKQRLLNVYVNNLTMMESVNRIHDMIREKQTSYVVEVNVDVVMKMEKDPYLKKISDEADLTLVDGQPLVWISKMKGNTPIREKISGSDLVPELLDELSRENRSVFILGGLGDTAKKAAKNVKKHYPGMSIAGTYAPPLGFEKDAKEIEKINHLVAKTHPDLLLACFGCPKQEKWIYENYKKCGAIVSVCAGATEQLHHLPAVHPDCIRMCRGDCRFSGRKYQTGAKMDQPVWPGMVLPLLKRTPPSF